MTKHFDHIGSPEARRFIVERLSDDTLLGRNGYTMRQSLYILNYKPEQERFAKDLVRVIAAEDLPARGVRALVVNLYDIVLDHLDGQGMWEALVEAELDAERDELSMMLQDVVGVADVIMPAIEAGLAENPDADLVLVTGVGETFPYIRTHAVLAELKTSKPVVLVFPGRYEQRPDGSTALNILDIEQGNSGGYYRATNVFDL